MSYFKAKMHPKFDFGWGSVPDPTGEITALLQIPYLNIRGPAYKVQYT